MEGFLAVGFLIGMQHALEADHLAAVGAMAAGKPGSRRRAALRGAVWGLGHTTTLFAVCSAVILLSLTLSDRTAAMLEFSVGVMLIVLGLDVLRRMRAKRVHLHVHDHGGGRSHIHIHSHAGETADHSVDHHDHIHPQTFPVRALAIGLVHGAAGSAGLLALSVAATGEPLIALGYVAVFGAGSILGMTALSFAAAWPLGAMERHAKRFHNGLSAAAAVLVVVLGVNVIAETGPFILAGM